MFEIVGEQIRKLNDTDLRELVGRLCEAELRASSEQTSGVHWGGSQTAADAGVDVEVTLSVTLQKPDFIPRPHTIFQVKKHSMPHSQIQSEMQPEGSLRPVIEDLAKESGAYIIVSGADNCAKRTMLNPRIQAMKNALNKSPNKSKLLVDFYCSSRLATWVNNHFSVTLWVREKIDQQLSGWSPHGNWALVPYGVQGNYLFSEDSRLHDKSKGNKFPVSVGIDKLRESVRENKSTRLIGLSGVGKTRLVQALFEEDIGSKPLHYSDAVYVDLGEEPDPSVRDMLAWLINSSREVILVVDNCSPEVHNSLTKKANAQENSVRLFTVEYDVIDDDKPSETEVFELMRSSDDRLIYSLLEQHYSSIEHLNAKKIVEFSDGNSKIALALAGTVRKGDLVWQLSDSELFDRLFYQRELKDEDLLRSAQVLSLVYSVSVDSQSSELNELGFLIGSSQKELYRQSARLLNRQLMQKRGNWRAILPHAISNRLALQALKNIHQNEITTVLLSKGNERLLKSFSKRLSYLENSEEAKQIVRAWMAEGGILAKPGEFNDTLVAVFNNIACVLPDLALMILEQSGDDVIHKQNRHSSQYVGMLLSLSHNEVTFEKVVRLLVRLAKTEAPDDNFNPIRIRLNRLYAYCYLDTPVISEIKIKLVWQLTKSTNSSEVEIGLQFLEAALHRSPNQYLGAASSDGVSWSDELINIAIGLLKNDCIAAKVITVICQNFWSLWMVHRAYKAVSSFCRAVRQQQFWADGWISAKGIFHSERDKMDSEGKAQLSDIVDILSPLDLVEETRLYALGSPHGLLGCYEVSYSEGMAKFASHARNLGERVAKSSFAELNTLLPLLVSVGNSNGCSFGEGLARGSEHLDENWKKLTSAFYATDKSRRVYECLDGYFLFVWQSHQEKAEEWLDSLLESADFLFFRLQCRVKLNQIGYERLLRAFENKEVPISFWGMLSNIGLDDTQLSVFLTKILNKPDGELVALDIWYESFRNYNKTTFLPALLDIGRQIALKVLVAGITEECDSFELDSKLEVIIKNCVSTAPDNEALALLELLKDNLELHWITRYSKSANTAATILPRLFLDTFLGKGGKTLQSSGGGNIFQSIPSHSIISWCKTDADIRFMRVAEQISPFKEDKLTELAKQLVLNSPTRESILNIFIGYCSLENISEHPFHSNSQKFSVVGGYKRKLQLMSENEMCACVKGEVSLEIAKLEQREQELLLLGVDERDDEEQRFEW